MMIFSGGFTVYLRRIVLMLQSLMAEISGKKHWHVSIPGLRPQITFVAVISSLAALQVFNEIYNVADGLVLGGINFSGLTMVFYVWRQAFRLNHAGVASAIAMVLLVITLAFSIMNIRLFERGTEVES